MPRGRKTSSDAAASDSVKADKGVFKFVKRNSNLPQEGKIPNFVFEDILGISIPDMRSLEIVKLKNVTVTEDNIASIIKVYNDKYKVGDKFQEWASLYGTVGCYPTSLSYALIKIKDIIIKNEISKLEGEADFSKLADIIHNTDEMILKYLKTDIVPHSADLVSKVIKDVQKCTDMVEESKKTCEEVNAACESLKDQIKEYQRQVLKDVDIKKKK